MGRCPPPSVRCVREALALRSSPGERVAVDLAEKTASAGQQGPRLQGATRPHSRPAAPAGESARGRCRPGRGPCVGLRSQAPCGLGRRRVQVLKVGGAQGGVQSPRSSRSSSGLGFPPEWVVAGAGRACAGRGRVVAGAGPACAARAAPPSKKSERRQLGSVLIFAFVLWFGSCLAPTPKLFHVHLEIQV